MSSLCLWVTVMEVPGEPRRLLQMDLLLLEAPRRMKNDSRSVSEMPAAVLFSLQPTLQTFLKPPVTMEG